MASINATGGSGTSQPGFPAATGVAAVAIESVTVVAGFCAYYEAISTKRYAFGAREGALIPSGFDTGIATIVRIGIGIIASLRTVDDAVATPDEVSARLPGSWASPPGLHGETVCRTTIAICGIPIITNLALGDAYLAVTTDLDLRARLPRYETKPALFFLTSGITAVPWGGIPVVAGLCALDMFITAERDPGTGLSGSRADKVGTLRITGSVAAVPIYGVAIVADLAWL